MERVPNLVYNEKRKATTFNNHQSELINLIKNAGITPSGEDNTQLYQAISTNRFAINTDIYCKDTGSLGNYVLTSLTNSEVAGYFAGLKLIFKANSLPTGTSTIKLNNLEEKPALNCASILATTDTELQNAYKKNSLLVAYYDIDKDIFLLKNDLLVNDIVTNIHNANDLTNIRCTLKIDVNQQATLTLPPYVYNILITMNCYNTTIKGNALTSSLETPLIINNYEGRKLGTATILKSKNITEDSFKVGNSIWYGTFISKELFYLYLLQNQVIEEA